MPRINPAGTDDPLRDNARIIVILSEAKDLIPRADEILRFAQDDIQ
jgi:hypothetical protein